MNTPDDVPAGSDTSRRDFLQQAAGIAAGVTVLAQAAGAQEKPAEPASAAGLLPTIKLGKTDITRLIIGGNPIYGHSHFNRLYSKHMTDWHTPERVQQLIKRCEEVGINCWQNSYEPRTLEDVDRVRDAGIKVHWLALGKTNWFTKPELLDVVAKKKPLGLAPHGHLADRLHREGKTDLLVKDLKRIRDHGLLVGLSAHNPALIELAEEKNWDIDYYMCCLYYLERTPDELKKILGPDLPIPTNETYLPSDPPRMFKTIQATKKPCLAYKVLAAGRQTRDAKQVRECFETAFKNIKPTDAIIVGMYNQFSDQVAEDAGMVREILAKK